MSLLRRLTKGTSKAVMGCSVAFPTGCAAVFSAYDKLFKVAIYK
jgi:hypothetical protein